MLKLFSFGFFFFLFFEHLSISPDFWGPQLGVIIIILLGTLDFYLLSISLSLFVIYSMLPIHAF